MTLTDARYWPAWGPYEETQGLDPYVALARYVCPPAVDKDPRLKVPRPDPDDGSAASDRALAQALYERLAGQGLSYALHPRVPRGLDRQQIRDPARLLNVGWGTCLDLAVTYAAMCLSEHLSPLLVVSESHALVALVPGRTPASTRKPHEPISIPGCATLKPGLLHVQDPAEFQDCLGGLLVPVECTCAVTRSQPGGETAQPACFDDAVLTGRTTIAQALSSTPRNATPRLCIVDVAWVHEAPLARGGVSPLEPPDSELDIQLSLPGGAGQSNLGGEQDAIFKRVRDGHRSDDGGIHVIAAPPGYGKSTIARKLVLEAPFGAGWFLGASDGRVLTNSLAEAELRSQNRLGVGLSDIDRAGYAEGAVGRLRGARHPWLVVLDNADADPDAAVRRLPAPRTELGQVIVVTTTNLEWAHSSGYRVHHLEPLTPDELRRELANAELERLAEGRWLLVSAFQRLAASLGTSTADLAVPARAQDSADVDPGAGAYWSMVRELALAPDKQRAARLAALLPPDSLSIEAVASVHPGAATRLEQVGVIEYAEGATYGRMHRLIGSTIRQQRDPEGETPERIALLLTQTQAACENLAEFGDRELVEELLTLIERLDAPTAEPQRELGHAFHAVGQVLELRNHIRLSAQAFERARRHLDLSLAADRRRDAECLLGMARPENQFGEGPDDFTRGLRMANEGYELMASDGLEAQAGRWLAMRGLLLKNLAKRPGIDETQAIAELRTALEVIEEANRLRQADPSTRPEELARSQYNLAGTRIELAKRERAQAAEHLDNAMTVYSAVLTQRKQFYPHLEAHGHIAACIAGMGTVNFYRAMLLDLERSQRVQLLRSATVDSLEAMRQRELLSGDQDNDDVGKSHRLMAKISMARHLVPIAGDKVSSEHEKLLAEVTEELLRGGLLPG